jgi:tRNA-splicing ligase RtcB (3'-phosphate/5'-hydroxy nucleic acid ligase)
MDAITGKTLVDWGYKPGTWFAEAITAAEAARQSGADEGEVRAAIDELMPAPALPLRKPGELPYHLNIRAEGPDDAENLASVDLRDARH